MPTCTAEAADAWATDGRSPTAVTCARKPATTCWQQSVGQLPACVSLDCCTGPLEHVARGQMTARSSWLERVGRWQVASG